MAVSWQFGNYAQWWILRNRIQWQNSKNMELRWRYPCLWLWCHVMSCHVMGWDGMGLKVWLKNLLTYSPTHTMLYMPFFEGVVVALGKGHSGTINAVKISPDEKVLSFFLSSFFLSFFLSVSLSLSLSVCLAPYCSQLPTLKNSYILISSMLTDHRFSGKHRGNIILGNAVCWEAEATTQQLKRH